MLSGPLTIIHRDADDLFVMNTGKYYPVRNTPSSNFICATFIEAYMPLIHTVDALAAVFRVLASSRRVVRVVGD